MDDSFVCAINRVREQLDRYYDPVAVPAEGLEFIAWRVMDLCDALLSLRDPEVQPHSHRLSDAESIIPKGY